MAERIRIHVSRSVGSTNVSIECPPAYRDATVEQAKVLLEAIPESTFQGDGIAITTIPGFGPSRLDGDEA